jgi:Domain of unknown function (DUF4375)
MHDFSKRVLEQLDEPRDCSDAICAILIEKWETGGLDCLSEVEQTLLALWFVGEEMYGVNFTHFFQSKFGQFAGLVGSSLRTIGWEGLAEDWSIVLNSNFGDEDVPTDLAERSEWLKEYLPLKAAKFEKRLSSLMKSFNLSTILSLYARSNTSDWRVGNRLSENQ